MCSESLSFDAKHKDVIHDAKFDYYGKKLATCSSDRKIKIFEVLKNKSTELCQLSEHEGPVWSIDWSHPSFGPLLASCGYDHKIVIWKELSKNKWKPTFKFSAKSSVNCVAWAPHELGACIGATSSDSSIIIVTLHEGEVWKKKIIKNAHNIGCTSLSWACCSPIGSLTSPKSTVETKNTPLIKRFVTGGCDNKAIIWKFDLKSSTWNKETELLYHKDWVRDVAWAPNIGLPYETIATCSNDKTVVIWKRDIQEKEWKYTPIKFDKVVWKVSWSVTGNMLAVTTADNIVTLWKENMDGSKKWTQISKLTEEKKK